MEPGSGCESCRPPTAIDDVGPAPQCVEDALVTPGDPPVDRRVSRVDQDQVRVPAGPGDADPVAEHGPGQSRYVSSVARVEGLPVEPGGVIGDCEIDTSPLTPANYDVTLRVADGDGETPGAMDLVSEAVGRMEKLARIDPDMAETSAASQAPTTSSWSTWTGPASPRC